MASVRVYEDRLKSLVSGPGGPIAQELARRAVRIESAAKQLCPVGTPESTGKRGYRGGRLRQSITWELGANSEGLYVDVGSNVEYALFVEMGTRYMAARPYLRPALAAGA